MALDSKLGNVSSSLFLRDFWQKKPLVIRDVLPDFTPPISPEELAGFALEKDVNSRLIIEEPIGNWQLEHGPLPEKRFSSLPPTHWTLLVQNLDGLDEEVNALLKHFRFIPNWRLDDIMISYATDQGSVGPHFDYYDVFLLQAQGTRRWKLGQTCDASTPLLPNQGMKILKDFNETNEYILEAGDMLYIPPGLAHWGIAEGEGMTISVGFRAPSHAELLLEFAHEIAVLLDEDQRYADPELTLQENAGEIKPEVIDKLSQVLLKLTADKNQIADIFGRLMTQQKTDTLFEPEQIESHYRLAPHSRCAWHGDGAIVNLYVNGESFRCGRQLANSLAAFEAIRIDTLNEGDAAIIAELYEFGALVNREHQQ